MSNRTELRTRLRQELGDTATQTIWSDTLLDNFLIESVQWYSRLFPLQATAYHDVSPGNLTFPLTDGALGISGVECPPGTPLPQQPTTTIGPPPLTSTAQTYSLWASTIYLGRPASGPEIGSSHLIVRILLPYDRPDPEEPWNGPPSDERLLILWSAAQSYAWLEGQESKRNRNPAAHQTAQHYLTQLETEIAARRRAATSRQLAIG